ncbi:hypothetical protein CCR75_003364 [Bremia lactucae]|uniref:Uncharacterized protein n=1 Tax=Bremia lactucae TaxID=4779 RepID=A0A976FI72_BRELC|nr:hypothetical protein CCR75_003364 [Bremia lactucae]
MEHGSVRELLHASATDADAVRQYLQLIESDELNGLLDGITPRDCSNKGKKKLDFVVQEEWLPLVHLLVHCETTRLRAASRIIQVLRQGSPSELESMQLLTEINLGYSKALDELHEIKHLKVQHLVKRRKLLEEIHVVLEIVSSFLEEVVRDAKPSTSKVLPQLLGLVPYFIGMSGELSDEIRISDKLAKLLELPWSCQTVPRLLDVLVENSALMSREGWQMLQENVERMVTTSPEIAGETMNSVIRECILVANVTNEYKWIDIARYLLTQLPVHLRQEAEFNLQMSFNQTPRIVTLVCQSIRCSKEFESSKVDRVEASSGVKDIEGGTLYLKADWRDLYLLLHSLQASKPILHHRILSSRVATEASVFAEIEELASWIVLREFKAFFHTAANDLLTKRGMETTKKHVFAQVELLLHFGGKQTYSREWKALLLMDIVFFWIEQCNSTKAVDKVRTLNFPLLLLFMQAIFETAPETRSEMLSSLFERSLLATQRKIAKIAISQIFSFQSGKLFPHLSAIQDWLTLQFQRSFDSARDFFLIASHLALIYKDLYNFLMVFLRKQLSTSNRLYQEFAVDIWCSWLENRLSFNEQQEEEIISALKTSVVACRNIQAWSYGRLQELFRLCDVSIQGPTISMRRSSWEEFYSFLSLEVSKFIVPTASAIINYDNKNDDAAEEDDDDGNVSQFHFSSLDVFYQQNASLDGAATTGLIFQKLLLCLIQFEKAVIRSKISSESLPIDVLNENDSDITQWLIDVVSNWKFLFLWICQDSDSLITQSPHEENCMKKVLWKLVARTYIGCGICNIAIEILLRDIGPTDERTESEINTEFDRETSDISVWSLLEVEFSLHRMLKILVSRYANKLGTSLAQEYIRAALSGLHRVLQFHRIKLLFAINKTFQETLSLDSSQLGRLNGMSYEAVLFLLDSCCKMNTDEESHGAQDSCDCKGDGLEAGQLLEILLGIYATVRGRVLLFTKPLQRDGSDSLTNGEYDERDKNKCSVQFSLYTESISANFPPLARHLVAPGKSVKTVVLLDTKEGEVMLGHICAAIGRILDVMIKTVSITAVHDQLGQVLIKIPWNRAPRALDYDSSNSFGRLSHYFFSDVQECIQRNQFTKLSVSCASLSIQLRDLAAEMANNNVVCRDSNILSSGAYDVLCDNVVYNLRLLRLLLNACLPTHLALHIQGFMVLSDKIEGIMQAIIIYSAKCTNTSARISTSFGQRELPIQNRKRRTETLVRRKRIRQNNTRDSLEQSMESKSESDFFDSSDSARPNKTSANSDLNANGVEANQSFSRDNDRVPHLQSPSSQSIAILAVLAVLEQSQTTMLSLMTLKNKNDGLGLFPSCQEALNYIRIHEFVIETIVKNREIVCENRKVPLKILHIIELSLRIGKASGMVQKGYKPELSLIADTTSYIYEHSVTSALTSRAWVDGVKDASQDSATKTKLSATLLKLDVFLLQVPSTVQIWLKEDTVCDEAKERLKALVAVVRKKLSPADEKSFQRGKGKSRQRLLGVVPLIKKRRKRLRSRHPIIDAFLNEEDGADAFADLEDFIE